MYRIDKVVVGIDLPMSRPWDAANLAAPTRLALRQAIQVAAAVQAPVHLVCALNVVSAGIFGSEEDAAAQMQHDQAEAESVMTELARQCAEQQSVSVTTTVVFGRAWLEILKAAGPSPDNLIVCGTRTKGAVSRMLFGSTGLKLLRNAPCPVWLVKPRLDEDADFNVLATTDLSEVGGDVLHAAVMLGQLLPVRLSVLHVVDDNLGRHMARTGASAEEVAKYHASLKDSAESQLHEQLSGTDFRTIEKGVQVHVAQGRADQCILDAIGELEADLLVMATSARGGISGMLIGNTAERLLPEINCSVLAIKPSDFECPVKLS